MFGEKIFFWKLGKITETETHQKDYNLGGKNNSKCISYFIGCLLSIFTSGHRTLEVRSTKNRPDMDKVLCFCLSRSRFCVQRNLCRVRYVLLQGVKRMKCSSVFNTSFSQVLQLTAVIVRALKVSFWCFPTNVFRVVANPHPVRSAA